MSCCPENTGRRSNHTPVLFAGAPTAKLPERVYIPGGTGLIGTSSPYIRRDGEWPIRQGQLRAYRISRGTVTNAEFRAFVDATGYVTEAETMGWSFVFWNQLPENAVAKTEGVPGSPWWRRVDGASWSCITGPECSRVEERIDHPVVHVSWNDARAYCSWAGGRLPTELEWEHAARGGRGDIRYPWGDEEPDDEATLLCNIWQGRFPQQNTARDGYEHTAPSTSFEANNYGLYNLVGNVWEWSADSYRVSGKRVSQEDLRLCKGGSFLCHKSYCYRYRIAARIGSPADNTTTHTGFRIVWDDS